MRGALSILILALVAPSGVSAQVAQQPTRPYRGLFGGGPPSDPSVTRHELMLESNLMSGYDDYLVPGSAGAVVNPEQASDGGYSGSADAGIRYWFGRQARAVSADFRVFSNAYSGSGVGPIVGGDLVLSATTDLGAKNQLDLTQTITYSPSLVMGAFESLANDIDHRLLPERGTGSGLIQQRSWAYNTGLTFDRRWTLRHTTALSAAHSQRAYLNQLGYDSATTAGGASHAWNLNRFLSVRGLYNHSELVLEEANGAAMPLTNDTVEGSLSYLRRLSPSRQVQLSVGGGGTHVTTLTTLERQPVRYWLPTGHVTFRLDLARTWALATDYRRSVNVLQGVTFESFATDALSVRADGSIGRRIELAFSGAYSYGQAGIGQAGAFDSYGGVAQLRYAVSRCCGLSLTYDYYSYRLQNIPTASVGVPAEYDRNAIRLGFFFRVPIYGSYGTQSEPQNRTRR